MSTALPLRCDANYPPYWLRQPVKLLQSSEPGGTLRVFSGSWGTHRPPTVLARYAAGRDFDRQVSRVKLCPLWGVFQGAHRTDWSGRPLDDMANPSLPSPAASWRPLGAVAERSGLVTPWGAVSQQGTQVHQSTPAPSLLLVNRFGRCRPRSRQDTFSSSAKVRSLSSLRAAIRSRAPRETSRRQRLDPMPPVPPKNT